jgi:hypothetical protein
MIFLGDELIKTKYRMFEKSSRLFSPALQTFPLGRVSDRLRFVVHCSNHDDVRLLRQHVEEVVAWPGIEPTPLRVASADLVSIRVGEDVANDDHSVFIVGREFGRVQFATPTIYLTLPLSRAHWTIVRGWAEAHLSSSFGLIPPGVMVIYTPQDEQEVNVCRSLFRCLTLAR